jgi:membrane dipeptidase
MTLPVADCHNDLMLSVQFRRDLGHEDPFGAFWLPQLQAGGVELVVLPVYTEDWFIGEGALRRALRTVESARQMAARHAHDVTLVTTASQLHETRAAGRIALLLAFEGMEPVGADIDLIDTFWQLGVRMASLTWNRRTPFADGLAERDTDAGLTKVGVMAIERMEELGMIVDISHLSDVGFDHIAGIAVRPFVASHSSCRAVNDHPRNLRDDQLQAVAAADGFVAMNGMGDFVGGAGSVDAFIDHIEHAVELIGPEHVGLGIDFIADVEAHTLPASENHGAGIFIPGLERPSDLPVFGERLVERLGQDTAARVANGTIIETLARLLPA